MVATDMFMQFARRMASTQGQPYIVIADTPNPIRQLEPEAMRKRVELMMPTIVEGLTAPPQQIAMKLKGIAQQQIHPKGVVRSSTPI